ncbi:protein kinase domain-containing protein [Streptomyces ferrugineus]|uniref:protein kinase domain-containing protein n=1 Tax=Streptomyces ferrugineus TaxID=1413221 RepID=UPI001D1329E1|nr:protein kinase [Streptomyces ferrugineus]
MSDDGGGAGPNGRVIGGRYRLVERIGSGGMGTVWRAVDELVGREVAVKQPRLPGDPEDAGHQRAAHRLYREARAAARVDHPAAVSIHDVVVEDTLPWIVMELVRGESLHEVLQRGPVEATEAARIGVAVLGALRAAHAVGIVHRDVKPANVLLGRHDRVVLTDFGIAHIQGEESLTVSGEFVGSLEFIAPERMSGRGAGPASDLWSLGVLLYAAVEGWSPFRRTTLESTLAAILAADPPEPKQAGPLGSLIVRLLLKDPERRPGADQVAAALEAVTEGWPLPEPFGDAAGTGPQDASGLREFAEDSGTVRLTGGAESGRAERGGAGAGERGGAGVGGRGGAGAGERGGVGVGVGEPEAGPGPRPEPLPRPEPEPESGPLPESQRESGPLPESQREPQPQRESGPLPESQREPQPQRESGPLPESQREPQPQRESGPLPESQREPESLPESGPLPESQREPESLPESGPLPESQREPRPRPDPAPEPATGTTPEPATGTTPEPTTVPTERPKPRGRSWLRPAPLAALGVLLVAATWFTTTSFLVGRDKDTDQGDGVKEVTATATATPAPTAPTPASPGTWTEHREQDMDAVLFLPAEYKEAAREGDATDQPRLVVYDIGLVQVRLTQWDKAPRPLLDQAQEAHDTWDRYNHDASTQATRTTFKGYDAVLSDTTYDMEESPTRVMQLIVVTGDDRMYELRVDMPKGTPTEKKGTAVFKGARDRLEIE